VAVYLEIVKKQGYPMDGVVEYYDIVQLPETHRKRPVFVLWRQEADAVGEREVARKMIRGSTNRDYTDQNIRLLERWVMAYKLIAHEIKIKLDRLYKKEPVRYYRAIKTAMSNYDIYMERAWDFVQSFRSPYYTDVMELLRNYRGQQAITAGMAFLMSFQEEMTNHQSTYAIGQFFGELHENGMIPADVHMGNIGLVAGESSTPVVTDPGHILTMDHRWDDTFIDQL
jgi:hypothetical protein